jgi:hypothetical protein
MLRHNKKLLGVLVAILLILTSLTGVKPAKADSYDGIYQYPGTGHYHYCPTDMGTLGETDTCVKLVDGYVMAVSYNPGSNWADIQYIMSLPKCEVEGTPAFTQKMEYTGLDDCQHIRVFYSLSRQATVGQLVMVKYNYWQLGTPESLSFISRTDNFWSGYFQAITESALKALTSK